MKLYSHLLPGNVCLHRMTVKYVIVETVSDVTDLEYIRKWSYKHVCRILCMMNVNYLFFYRSTFFGSVSTGVTVL